MTWNYATIDMILLWGRKSFWRQKGRDRSAIRIPLHLWECRYGSVCTRARMPTVQCIWRREGERTAEQASSLMCCAGSASSHYRTSTNANRHHNYTTTICLPKNLFLFLGAMWFKKERKNVCARPGEKRFSQREKKEFLLITTPFSEKETERLFGGILYT